MLREECRRLRPDSTIAIGRVGRRQSVLKKADHDNTSAAAVTIAAQKPIR